MKRTLLAVGIAVLISMMLAPQGDLGGQNFPFLSRPEEIVCYCPFFLDLCTKQDFLPRAFILQTIFLAVAAAVIVNLFLRRPKT